MTEDGPTVCEVCGGPMRRVLFPTGIIFKGSGFYRNDSRASSGSASAPTSTGSTDAAPASGTPATTGGASGGEGASAAPTPKPAPATD